MSEKTEKLDKNCTEKCYYCKQKAKIKISLNYSSLCCCEKTECKIKIIEILCQIEANWLE